MNNLPKIRQAGLVLFIAILIGGVAASIAIAQSNRTFNLNSPVSFPVDI